jgi:exopolyphosphatase/guanosine-5'-triphosphate,3'-diphosphate pyrophosphatase
LYGRRTTRHTYGALDLGTNNCRLLVARPTDEGFVVVDAFSRVVRLGEGLASSGRISDAAMDRALQALSVCGDKLRRRRVSLSRSVATEACRRAVNGREFVARVSHARPASRSTSSRPEEEARLAMLGCHAARARRRPGSRSSTSAAARPRLVLVDTDGERDARRSKCWWSAPWGGRFADRRAKAWTSQVADERACAPTAGCASRARHAFRRFAELSPRIRRISPDGDERHRDDARHVHLALPSYDRKAVGRHDVAVVSMRAISG